MNQRKINILRNCNFQNSVNHKFPDTKKNVLIHKKEKQTESNI